MHCKLLLGLVAAFVLVSINFAYAEVPQRIEAGEHHLEKLVQEIKDVFIEEGGTLELYLNKNEFAELEPYTISGPIINYGTIKFRGLVHNEGVIENWGHVDALKIINKDADSKFNNWGTLKTTYPVRTEQGTFNNCGQYDNWFLENNPEDAMSMQQKPPTTKCVESDAVSMWHADGNLNDGVGENDGEPAFIDYGPGINGDAFYFTGKESIKIGNSDSLNLAKSITITAWVSAEDLVEGQFAPILTKWTQDQTRDSYSLQLWKRAGSIQLAGAVMTPSGMAGLVNGQITPNTWTHVAMTYNGTSGDQSIYVDGKEVAWQLKPGGINTSDSLVIIGSEDNKNPLYFMGLIDSPAIYDVSLSADEIRTNMQMSQAPDLSRGDFDFAETPNPFIQQTYLGVSPADVVCTESLELVISPSNNAACVFESTIPKLLQIGWTIP